MYERRAAVGRAVSSVIAGPWLLTAGCRVKRGGVTLMMMYEDSPVPRASDYEPRCGERSKRWRRIAGAGAGLRVCACQAARPNDAEMTRFAWWQR